VIDPKRKKKSKSKRTIGKVWSWRQLKARHNTKAEDRAKHPQQTLPPKPDDRKNGKRDEEWKIEAKSFSVDLIHHRFASISVSGPLFCPVASTSSSEYACCGFLESSINAYPHPHTLMNNALKYLHTRPLSYALLVPM
jgi:hypothetical protein